jgi:hypothetical protein
VLLTYLTGADTIVVEGDGFTSLRTYEGVTYGTYREACIARRYFADDLEWHRAMNDASQNASPHQLRGLFVSILIHANDELLNPMSLWEAFRDEMAEDFAYLRRSREDRVPTPSAVDHNAALLLIGEMLAESGSGLDDFNLPQHDPRMAAPGGARTRTWEQRLIPDNDDEVAILTELVEVSVALLNEEQRAFYEEVS